MGKAKLYEEVRSLARAGKRICLLAAFALLLPLAVSAQSKQQIQGHVYDQNGEPLTGAMVKVAGQKTGVVTDINGRFSLPASSGAQLTISFVGYEQQQVAARDGMKIKMTEDNNTLNELVVIGYGTVKKSDLTGAVGSVKDRQFNAEPIKNTGDVLKGRMAGVTTSQFSGGNLGAGPSIRVRGISSLKYGNDPLWVVDGVVGGSFASVADIESIEVLKDAASTAIYGSRGSNGVVLVTTKKGKAGKSKIEFSTDISVGQNAKTYDVMSPTEFADAYEAYVGQKTFNRNADGTVDGYDYQDNAYQSLLYQDYKLSISGGNEKTRYLVSGHVLDQKGIVKNRKYQSMAVRANMQSDVTKWLTITTDITGSRSKNTNPGGVDFEDMVNFDPTVKPVDDMDNYLDPSQKFNGPSIMYSGNSNPMSGIWDIDRVGESYGVSGYIDALFKILPGLTFDTQGFYSFSSGSQNNYQTARYNSSSMDFASNSLSRGNSYQWTNNLTYQTAFGDHNLTATAVYEVSKSESRTTGVSFQGLDFPELKSWNCENVALSTRVPVIGFSENQLQSVFGRLMYNYAEKYFLTATVRADGSSKFADGNRWGWFPSAAAAWDIAKENFMKDNGIFNQLKLRASFGITGNQAVGSYATWSFLNADPFAFGNMQIDGQGSYVNGMWAKKRGNSNLKWETTTSFNIGIDFSILRGKVSGNIDWYRKNTKDLIADRTLPILEGGGFRRDQWNVYLDNVGKMYSTGIDITINAYPVTTKDFDWATTFTASWLKTEVTDLGGEEIFRPDASASGLRQYNFFALEEGKPASNFELFKWAGINENGEDLFYKKDGTTTTTPDKTEDRFVMGNPIPKWSFGWNNQFRYKQWSASFLFRASTGFQRFNLTRLLGCAKSGDQSQFITLKEAHEYGWDYVSDKSTAKFSSLKNTKYNDPHSSQYLEDADFLRLENISIGYTFPKSLTRIADITLSASAQNLFTITGYKGSDPESITNYDNDMTVGLDYGSFPAVRSYTFSLKLTF